MAWLSRVNFTASDVLSYTDLNNLGNDIRAWGGNVNGGAYTLSNVVLSASSGTMATVIGGTGTTSTLTLRSTSGVGTTGADIVFQTGNNGATEVMRLQNGGNVGIGVSSPAGKLDIVTGVYRGYFDDAAGSLFRLSAVNAANSAYGPLSVNGSVVTFQISASEKMRIDSNGNVGIGTSGPSRTLDVNGSCIFGGVVGVVAGDSAPVQVGVLTFGQSSASTYAWIQSWSSRPLAINPSGNNVGIGTSSPSYQLQLSTDSAAKPTTNTWTIASDSRLKTVKGEYQKGLAEICQVRPVSYEYNGKAGFIADGKDKVSILAQELMQVFPECVDTFKGKLEEDGPEIDLYNYNGHAITFALINAIKELKAKIDILEARN